MRRASATAGAGLLCALAATAAAAQTGDGRSFAEEMTANVAHIRAGNQSGFGFIVGLGSGQLLLATAFHTVEEAGEEPPTICFPYRGLTCEAGTVGHIADAVGKLPALDLVFLTVPYPEGLPWRPDVMAEKAADGAAVKSIGRGESWYVPDQPGRISGADSARRLLRYAGLTVAEGVSGAPIVSEDGIVAMHVQSLGEGLGAEGIQLEAIRNRLVEQARQKWILVPRAECRDLAPHRSTLTGRAITLHFDAGAPDAAMQATARLHCLGARVTLAPVWDAAAWPGEAITYPRGGVRLMRSLQGVLAPLGRLDGTLGEPAGDAELWIR